MSNVDRSRFTNEISLWRLGEELSFRKLNAMVRVINRNSIFRKPRQVIGSKARYGGLPQSTAGSGIKRLVFVGLFDDHILTNPIADDGSIDTQLLIYIAKPFMLQQTPFNGQTRNSVSYIYTSFSARTASKDGFPDESQVIVPAYVAGDILMASSNIDGGTGVTLVNVGLAENRIALMDMNVDARAWAKVSS